MSHQAKLSTGHPEHGYTTIEIVMALLVVLILSAFSVPMVRSMVYDYRLQGAIASCTWAIQSTRYQALEQGYNYQVVFSSSGGTYQIQNEQPPATSYSNVGTTVPLSGAGITVSADTTLQFKPNGAVQANTGALNFTLTYKGTTKQVAVSTYGNVTVTCVSGACIHGGNY